jgi:hypothetical protein
MRRSGMSWAVAKGLLSRADRDASGGDKAAKATITWEDPAAAMASRPPDIRLDLTQPPSFNDCWVPGTNGHTGKPGIFRTAAYRSWTNNASSEVMVQVPRGRRISGLYAMRLTVPDAARDGDNNIKPVPDALQRGGAVSNDKNVRRLVLDVDPTMRAGLVTVELWALAPEAGASPRKNPLRPAPAAEKGEAPGTAIPSASCPKG